MKGRRHRDTGIFISQRALINVLSHQCLLHEAGDGVVGLWWGVAGSLISEAEMVLQIRRVRADLRTHQIPRGYPGPLYVDEQDKLKMAKIRLFSNDSRQLTGSLRDEGSSMVRVLFNRCEKEIQMAREFKSIVNTYF